MCDEGLKLFSWILFLQVQHPAAKMIVMASHMQEQEVGDGTNFVLVFAGALLELAEELLRMGLSVSEVNKCSHRSASVSCWYFECYTPRGKKTHVVYTNSLSFLPQVIEGYEKACKKALEILPDCSCSSAKNLHDVNEATSLIRTAVISKQYGNEDFLANLIAQACGESAIQTT